MKRRFTILSAALTLLAFLAIPMGMRGQTRAEVVAYTLEPATGSNNSYTGNCDITIEGITWNLTGNSQQIPWRIGGKSLTNVDRPLYSKTAISDDISKIEVTHGAASNITVNSWTVIVATDASFSNVVSTLTPTFTANATTTINRPTGADWSNCYYKFVYNVSVSGSTNRFIQFSQAKFYKQEGSGPVIATPTFNPAGGSYTTTQNVTISCETQGSTIYYTTDGSTPDNTSTQYDGAITVSETTTINAIAYVGNDASSVATATYTIVNLEHAGTEADPYSVADARTAIDANVGVTGVYATGIVSEIVTAYNSNYGNITFDIVDELGNTATLRAYRCGGTEAANVAVNDVVIVSGNLIKYNSIYEFAEGCQLVSLTHPVVTTPSVTVTPATINAPAEGANGTLAITYENIPDLISFDYYFCDANGDELEDPIDWIDAEINEENDVYSISYTIDPNDGAARTAYFKVYTFEGNTWEEVYDIVTVNQTEYVVDYAELPFEWSSFDEIPTGITNNGVTINNYLKFDTSGDNIILKFNERPGTLEFEVKGNPGNNGWAGTFKVQTSVDGVSYTDLQTYTELPTTEYQPESFATLDENVRYIKWVYTEKVSGNVAVNYIYLAAYEAPVPAITVESTTITATAEETEGSLNVTYTAIETDLGIDIYWFESDGTTPATEPAWILAEVNSELNVDYVIEANNGEARTAYFKLYGLDGEANSVYSELVTITQAAAPQQYTLTVEPFENLEIITFVDDEMVLETAGEIQVNEGAHIMLSIVADEGYVMETLMVNGVNHVNDIAEDFTYEFDMPAEAVTISATALEQVAPVGGDYVRITSLDQLTDGSIVVIAARYDEEHTNGYYAMSNATSGKPTGVLFTSTISGDNEILPASITDNEDNYYWTVNVTENGYTFTNAEGSLIGYGTSGTNFVTGGTNTEWTIESETAGNSAMVAGYTGFVIKNFVTNSRAFAFNGSAFGPYSWTNNNAAGYNFFLDFFVQSEALPTETYELGIKGYGTSDGGYYLIASPVTSVTPSVENGFITNAYDLYMFNEGEPESNEWVNYNLGGGAHGFDALVSGNGYLYASQDTTTLVFTGTPYTGNGEFPLSYTENAEFAGWNLVGNPYTVEAYIDRPFYRMAEGGAEVMSEASTGTINMMEGVFVVASAVNDTVHFSTEAPGNTGKVVMNVFKGRSNTVDRAIVCFGEGRQLPKFMLNPNHTKLYIPQYEEDYAVVRSEEEAEMPVSFKAAENGTYTISFSIEEVEMDYMHLIDQMTGADIDLLATPSYTFEANTTDYANRFNLIFATTNSVSENGTSHFAFYNGSEWSINNTGEATLQVVDMMGRIIRNESINGNANVNLNEAAGVYVIRLVNGSNVKVQKVVVR